MSHIFISHSTADDAFVAELRRALGAHNIPVWTDSRNLRGGAILDAEIRAAIGAAEHCLVVLSPETVNSPWVKKEIDHALAVQSAWDDYRVIPLLLPGIRPAALGMWFDAEPLGVKVELAPGALSEALPAIMAALGRQMPADATPAAVLPPARVDELILELRDPIIVDLNGAQRARATAILRFQPADGGHARAVESARYTVTAPLGPVEREEMRWYLEEFSLWPVGIFADRAKRTEQALTGWGKALYAAALGSPVAQKALTAWQNGGGDERRFSLWVDQDLPDGSPADAVAQAHAGATELLALPWEILHDGGGFWLNGGKPVAVRRRLPNRSPQAVAPAEAPIRILLLSPRPELTPDDHAIGYFDHRSSALPLALAVENLGDLARLTVLHPPTLPALKDELRRAKQAGTPYHVVHFDGHGVYDRHKGLGALLFEAAQDSDRLTGRRSELVHADRLAGLMRDYAIPLVFLDACQSSQSQEELNSVATRLLQEGVSSVVAMSYTVLVETSRRFVERFYAELAQGRPVGGAMLAGQQALEADAFRIVVMGAGDLSMRDWFVPVLYQDAADPQLFTRLPGAAAAQLTTQRARLRLGELPDTPPQSFVGRSRELLMIERLLTLEPYAVVRGSGGAGKTTLAVEAARWLVRNHRFARAAFVSLEAWQDDRAVLDVLAHQLLPGNDYSVALFPTLDAALQPVLRALRDDATIIVIDNVESVLGAGRRGGEEAGGGGRGSAEAGDAFEPIPASSSPPIFALCQKLLAADPRTRLIFTSREGLPSPFEKGRCRVELGALSPTDAVRLVERVLAAQGMQPAATDAGATAQEVLDLVNGVGRHARALVLLAREVARQGVTATTANLHQLMADLEAKYPGDRENSLFASVELSLRRLPAEMQEQVKNLAVFHGGGHVANLGMVMGVEPNEARAIVIALIEVGMADDMGYRYLRLDPALAPYLARSLDPVTLSALRARWTEAMIQLVGFLSQQRSGDAKLAAQLTLLELPNLLALLDHLGTELATGETTPDQIVAVAGGIEQLLADLGRPTALARSVILREAAAAKLDGWSAAQLSAKRLDVERLLAQGDGRAALQAAQVLHQRAITAGEDAYGDAAYDVAFSHILLGRVLRHTGRATAALPLCEMAQTRFQDLADAGNRAAARMASISIVDQGDCLTDMGRLDEAVAKYEEGMRRAEELDDQRQVAVSNSQLGTVRMLQERYAEALAAWDEARRIFHGQESTGEATAWHQMGLVHKRDQQWDAAERAYRQSLAINVQQGNRAGQANNLIAVGALYDTTNRFEEAVRFYRQAAAICVFLDDLRLEGMVCNNIANSLLKLDQLVEARQEIQRAIECKQPFGAAAMPWTSWDILHDIETASHRPDAAWSAWVQARDAYLAYRQQGGYAQTGGGKFVEDVVKLLQDDKQNEAVQLIGSVEKDTKMHSSLRKLAAGVRLAFSDAADPLLAEDSDMNYDHAAELLLLLERLGGG
ncbi:MAG: tetratricopeptide repeat protein [Caldilineaceae bacterium]|nr:tetratricopeptide repeat protein [Caldilineaceae bacterium]MBP8106707.1 tetratricopeptide repeat protein [Caldilineaceae bacterium]MBP8124142.1 tetratricopeptide repeat protein [Caldilineaceae bacterium]MBP9074615.1 tetratricopeptide repeat protein [Caldilineaceae bacterium]